MGKTFGKCPKCGKELKYIEGVRVEVMRAHVHIDEVFGDFDCPWMMDETLEGPDFRCPYCHTHLCSGEEGLEEFLASQQQDAERE